jgi:hypothetical protein
MEIPDFRKKDVRDRYRNDNWIQKHVDPDRIFPDDQDLAITSHFCEYYSAAQPFIMLMRSTLDAMKVFDVTRPAERINTINLVKDLRSKLPQAKEAFAKLRSIYEAYPTSPGGVAIKEKLILCEADRLENMEAFDAFLKDFLLKQ